MSPKFAAQSESSIPLAVVTEDGFDSFLEGLGDADKTWAEAQGFKGKLGQSVVFPSSKGDIASAALGVGSESSRKRGRFHVAKAASGLPNGLYQLPKDMAQDELKEAALGWLLQSYRFDRYRERPAMAAQLEAPQGGASRQLH